MEEKTIVRSSFWSNFFKVKNRGHEIEEFLSSLPPFSDLERKDIVLLSKILHSRDYLSGEYIFHQGDPGIGIYLINEGDVEIQKKDELGGIFPLASLSGGDFFGELALIDGEKRPASAIARSDCHLSVLFKPDLDEFINKYPKKGVKILQGFLLILTSRLRKMNDDYFRLQRELNREKIHGTEY